MTNFLVGHTRHSGQSCRLFILRRGKPAQTGISANSSASRQSLTALEIAQSAGTRSPARLLLRFVAAGVFANLSQRSDVVKWLGLFALALWIVAALLFIVVVAAPTLVGQQSEADGKDTDADAGWDTESDFVEGVRAEADEELRGIKKRTLWALGVTVAAVVLTLVALSVAIAYPSGPNERAGAIAVTGRASLALRLLCGRDLRVIKGRINVKSLQEDVVSIEPVAGMCPNGAETIRVAMSDVVGVVFKVSAAQD